MDENPYRSPESESKIGERPKNAPAQYSKAALYGFLAFSGFFMSLVGIARVLSLLGVEHIIRTNAPLFPVAMAVIASPVGAAVAWWTWRVPESKWPVVLAILLVLSPVLLPTILLVFLGQ